LPASWPIDQRQSAIQATIQSAQDLVDADRIDMLQIEFLFARFYERNESFSGIEEALDKEYRVYTPIATDNRHVGEALYVQQDTSATTGE